MLFEGGSLRFELTVEECRGHCDKYEYGIGCNFAVGGRCGLSGRSGRSHCRRLSTLSTKSTSSTKSTLSTLLINFPHPLRLVLCRSWPPVNQILAARIFHGPFREAALTQKIFVVQPQFFEARAGDVGQLEL